MHEETTTIDVADVCEDDRPASSDSRAALVYLIVRNQCDAHVLLIDDGDEVTFGRAAHCTVRLDGELISREHARLRRAGSILEIEDLGSRNGTFVNGHRLAGPARLRSGLIIHLGDAEVIIACSEGPPRDGDSGLRLEHELCCLRERGERAIALWLTGCEPMSVPTLVEVPSGLEAATLIEDLGDGVYVVLFEPSAEAIALDAARTRAAKGGEAHVLRVPDDGADVAALRAEVTQRRQPRLQRRPLTRLPPLDPRELPTGIVVADAAMVAVFALARRVASAPTTVLITGATGTGKEVIAEQIHRWSGRRAQPFVRLNCASLPDGLLESELFGHERGAFTGAERRKLGYIEAAHGGTLFLDEIGEMPLAMQAKLLRVLEARTVIRLGSSHETPVDVRVLSATHRDLRAEVAAGRFRDDLFFRLAPIEIHVPPLRERPGEIALLADRFARMQARALEIPAPVIDRDTADALLRYPWPGNVRELRNAMEHAVLVCQHGRIEIDDLPASVQAAPDRAARPGGDGPMRSRMQDVERSSIEEALAAENGNQTRAARRLGISRRSLVYKLTKYRLRA